MRNGSIQRGNVRETCYQCLKTCTIRFRGEQRGKWNSPETRSIREIRRNEKVARVTCSSFDFRFQKLPRPLQVTSIGVVRPDQVVQWGQSFIVRALRLLFVGRKCEIMSFSFHGIDSPEISLKNKLPLSGGFCLKSNLRASIQSFMKLSRIL